MSERLNAPGWATYLRVSDEDKQTPERSFAMQRQRIQEQLLISSEIPFKREYCDMLTGTSPNRGDYQQMLADAESGRFSHLGLYRADRFGRNAVEGLQAATRLIGMGINIRVANMPTLTPEEPDGFFMFLIQMGLAQREVDVLALRTADGMEAKLRSGGWPNKAPEGYVNKERNVGSNKYERWVEDEPQYIQPVKEAWDLLLTDRYTLEQICEELTKRGYTRSSGRPWAWNDPKSGVRRTARNRLHEIFNHPFYAGWAVSERFNIKMGEVRGNWKPVVTTSEFERGRAILLKHGNNKSYFKRHHYLLRNMLWVKVGKKYFKLCGSTPTGRSKSYSYYVTQTLPDSKQYTFGTEAVDLQIPGWINRLAIDPNLIPDIREIYKSQIKKLTFDDKAEKINQLKRKLVTLNEEEARLGRLLVSNKISENTYDKLRSEWKEKIFNIQLLIEELEFDASQYLDDLEIALVLMANISVLYERLNEKLKTELLRILVKRIIINPQGEIISHELHSPFVYLTTLVNQLFLNNEEESGSEHVRQGSPGKF